MAVGGIGANSLAARMIFILILTLVAAQAVNTYIFTRQKHAAVIRLASADAIDRMVDVAADPDRLGDAPPRRPPKPPRGGRPPPQHVDRPPLRGRAPLLPRNGLAWRHTVPIVENGTRGVDPTLADRLALALAANGINVAAARAIYIPMQRHDAPAPTSGNEKLDRRRPPPPYEVRFAIKLTDDDRWINARYPVKPPPPSTALSDYLVSGSVFAVFLALAVAMLALNISRPLNALAAASRKVGRQNPSEPIPTRGPTEIRDALTAFNEMNARVTELLREKDLMLGALGHDLRTPLTSLRLRIEQMSPPEVRAQAIETIDETARLIEDILDLARSGGAETTLAKYNLTALLEDLAADYAETGAAVTFTGAPKIVAQCNPTAMQRLLRNLVDNALKYAGEAHLSLGRKEGSLRISVEDDGPGITDDTIERVMDPFERGDQSRNRATGGAGLGLAIARAIARAHGGDLKLENREPKGLRATVSLPDAG